MHIRNGSGPGFGWGFAAAFKHLLQNQNAAVSLDTESGPRFLAFLSKAVSAHCTASKSVCCSLRRPLVFMQSYLAKPLFQLTLTLLCHLKITSKERLNRLNTIRREAMFQTKLYLCHQIIGISPYTLNFRSEGSKISSFPSVLATFSMLW